MAYHLLPETLTPIPDYFILQKFDNLWTQGFMTHYRSSGQPFTMSLGAKDLADEGAKIRLVDDYFWASWTQGFQIGDKKSNNFSLQESVQAIWNDELDGVYTIFDSESHDI